MLFIYWPASKSNTLLFCYFSENSWIKENKLYVLTFFEVFFVFITKQKVRILHKICFNERNRNTIENRNVWSLIPCLATSCSACRLASSVHAFNQSLYVCLRYPTPLLRENINRFHLRPGWIFPCTNPFPELVPEMLYGTDIGRESRSWHY